jgi:hypothetical protein
MKKTKYALVFLVFTLFAISAHARVAPESDPFAPLRDDERSAIENRVIGDTLKAELHGSRYRIFGTESTAVKVDHVLRRYAYSLIYDYTHNKTYNVVSDVTERIPGKIVEVMKPSTMPPPSQEEYAEALAAVGSVTRIKTMLDSPTVKLQPSFPVNSPSPCDVDRCIEVQVNDLKPGGNYTFLLLVSYNLSKQEIAEIRQPSSPTSR